MPPPLFAPCVQSTRNGQRHAHAAADAQSRQPLLGVAALHLMQQGSIDFRAVIPLVHGLSKLLYRKFNYLLSETSSTLETLKNPFADLNEGAEANNNGEASKKHH